MVEEGIGFHTEAGAGIDCHMVAVVGDRQGRLEANNHLLEVFEGVLDRSCLDHHRKAADDQVGMERSMAGMGDRHLLQTGKAGWTGTEHSSDTHFAGKEGCCNPAGSCLVVARPDNFLAMGSEPDIRLERMLGGCSSNYLDGRGSGIRSSGIGEACLECSIEGMGRPYRSMRRCHRCLPWLLDHDCGFQSRLIRMFSHDHRGSRGHASLANLFLRRTPCGCGRL